MTTEAQRIRSLNSWMARASRLRTPDQFRRAVLDLPSVFSKESVLRDLILIRLLEALEIRQPKKRPLTAWQKFVAKELKAGRSIVEASQRWRTRAATRSTQPSGRADS